MVRHLTTSEVVPRSSGAVRRAHARLAVYLACSDALCVAVALAGSYLGRFGFSLVDASYIAVVLIALPVWLGVFNAFHLYQPRYLSAVEEFRRIIGATALGIVVIVMVSFWWKAGLSRAWVGLSWLLSLSLTLLARRFWRWYAARRSVSGQLGLKTLIVGDEREARRIQQTLGRGEQGYVPVGTLTVDGKEQAVDGQLDEVRAAIHSGAADCIFLTPGLPQEVVREVMTLARGGTIEVRMAANLTDMLTNRLSISPIGDIITMSLRPVRFTRCQRLLKRAFDLGVASVGVVVLAPLWLVIAVAIKVSSRGPVLFTQDRVTQHGRVFRMYKFRTMLTVAEHELEECGVDLSQPYFKLQDGDPRITRMGRVLRRFSLDELPQLINVLRGDMSLVGPRPLPVEQVAANPGLRPRHEVKAGMTGWWQVSGRSDVDPERALRLDLFYIDNWSLTLDLFILLKTVGTVLSGRGAY